MFRSIVQDFVTLLVVVNPIAKVPLFIVLTDQLAPNRQRAVAVRAIVVSLLVLLFFMVCGQPALAALGVNLVSVQIAGGLILLILGLRMVLDEAREPSRQAAGEPEDIAVFPLAMPFIAGPGAIMSVMVLTDNDLYTLRDQAETFVALLAVLAISLVALLGARALNRLLGRTGVNVVSRVMGLILASLAVQSMLTGLRVALGR
ncbi:MAG: MarC family protein [Acetobacteraceae bacterium]